MEKYKICPTCGAHNSPALLECSECETDLTSIKVIDSSMEAKEETPQDKPESLAATEVTNLVKVCDCGAKNPPQARKCEVCGEDISDIVATSDMDKINKSYQLQAVGEEFSVVFDKPVVVVGREAELSEYLKEKPYVSRQHAKFVIEEDKITIENLSKTNFTFINNIPVKDDKVVTLAEGDEIGLGGKEINGERQKDAAYFAFHIIT